MPDTESGRGRRASVGTPCARAARPRAVALGLVALLTAWVAARSFAADEVGPPLGRATYQTSIKTGPQGEDTDLYGGDLVVGERLTVKLTSPFNSGLFPTLELIGPGSEAPEPVQIRSRRAGRKLEIRNFEIPRAGRWCVRVGAQSGSEGGYALTIRVKSPRKLKSATELLPAGESRVLRVSATDGAELDATFKAAGRAGAGDLRLVALRDPEGRPVGGDGAAAATAVAKKRSLRLKRFPLSGGTGDYELELRAEGGPVSFRSTLRVRAPKRIVGKRKRRLDSDEPYVEPSESPVNVAEAMEIRLSGVNLTATGLPSVFFGENRALQVELAPMSGALLVIVPPGPEGELVPLTVLSDEGQGIRRDGYFYYVPTPEFDAVERLDGTPLVGVTTEGDERLRLRGRNFRTGLIVRLVPGGDVVPTIVSSEVLEFNLPAGAPGELRIEGYDAYLHEPELDLVLERKVPPRFANQPYDPIVVAAERETLVSLLGTEHDIRDVLRFDGAEIPSLLISETTRTFTVPALPDGVYPVALVDRVGTVVEGPSLRVKDVGLISSIAVVQGAVIGTDGVPLAGGTRLRVFGDRFHSADRVTVGSASADATSREVGSFDVVLPSHPAGTVDLVVTDAADQVSRVDDALRYLGFVDATTSRSPGASGTDDLRAERLAVGDLDGDGDADDVVLVTSSADPGARGVRTRMLLRDDDGLLSDATSDLPAEGDDAAGLDDWNATAVAVGDPDGDDDHDIVIAGRAPDSTATSSVRVFENDGSGEFTVSDLAPATSYTPAVTARDETGADHDVYAERVRRGAPRGAVLVDLDDDGDDDLVVVRDHFDLRAVELDPTVVDFGTDPPSVDSEDAATGAVDRDEYFPATQVYEATASGFVEVTADAVPGAGDSTDDRLPCLVGRDVVAALVDDDEFPDLIVAWNDPTTVSSFGRENGPNIDSRRVATRVLINDGTGEFTDETATWMPAGAARGGFDYWHADAVAAADLDGDGDDDLVLALDAALNAYATDQLDLESSALRVLRNDGATTGFTDITDVAVPALAARGQDNLRGSAVVATDVDGDGRLDLLVSTTTILVDDAQRLIRSTRLLLGEDGLAFRDGTGFLVASSTDSLQARRLGVLPATEDDDGPTLLLAGETTPFTGPTGERFRVHVWDE